MTEIAIHDPEVPVCSVAARPFAGDIVSVNGVTALAIEGTRLSLLGANGSVAVFQLAEHRVTGRQVWALTATVPPVAA